MTRGVEAKQKTEKASEREKILIEIMSSYDNAGKVNLENLKKNLSSVGIETNDSNTFPLKVEVRDENMYITEDGTIYKEAQTGKIIENENQIYVRDGYSAIIPVGFTVSGLEEEQSMENGLVIYDLKGHNVLEYNGILY